MAEILRHNEGVFQMDKTWYLLYDGNSADGRGTGSYMGRTLNQQEARKHYDKCMSNPYSTGKVVIVTDTTERLAGQDTDWDSL